MSIMSIVVKRQSDFEQILDPLPPLSVDPGYTYYITLDIIPLKIFVLFRILAAILNFARN